LLPIQTAGAVNASYFGVPWVAVQGQAGGSTRAIGRYAFWVDDNGSRLNLNVASLSNRPHFFPTNNRPLWVAATFGRTGNSNVFSNLFGTNFPKLFANPAATNPWGYFFTPRQLANIITNVTNTGTALMNLGVQQLGYQMAGMNPNRPDPTYPLADGAPLDLNAGGNSGFLETVRSGFAGSESALLEALDEVIDRQLSGDRYEALFGQRNGFVQKYGRDVLRQIVVNLNDGTLPTGSQDNPGNVSVTGAGDSMLVDGIPNTVAGNRPFPFLNEIASRALYFYDSNSATLNMQVWLAIEIMNPYPVEWGDASAVVVEATEWSFEGSYDSGPDTVPIPKVTVVLEPSYELRWDEGVNLPRRSFTNLVLGLHRDIPNVAAGASNFQITNTLDLRAVKYLQWPSQPSTIRDWAHGDDLPVWEATSAAGSVTAAPDKSTNFGPVTNVPGYVNWNDAAAVIGVAKNDPRVRRFAGWDPPLPPWLPVGGANAAPTIGSNNSTVDMRSRTGIDGIDNDLPPASGNVFQHPDFDVDLNNYLQSVPMANAFDISKVHTGLQWRTLQLRAQDAAEGRAGFVPDWALLGVFAASNAAAPAVPVKLNINAVPFPAVTAEANLATLATGPNAVLRVDAFASLLSGNTNTNGLTTNTTNAVFSASGADSYLAAATNLATMRFNANWAGRRARDLSTNLPTNAYLMPAEALEVQGMYRANVSEAVNEERVRGFYDAVSTHSDTFTIFAVGQALDVQGRSTGEQRLRVTVERMINAAGVVQFRPVLTEFVASP